MQAGTEPLLTMCTLIKKIILSDSGYQFLNDQTPTRQRLKKKKTKEKKKSDFEISCKMMVGFICDSTVPSKGVWCVIM